MKCFRLLAVFFFLGASVILADEKKEPSPSTAISSQDLEVEKLKLEIERLKLENERLQLQIQTLKINGSDAPTPADKDAGTKEGAKEDKKDGKSSEKTIGERQKKSEELAKQFAGNEKMVVLDFTNGEIWYKGIRYSIYQFTHLAADVNWQVKSAFVKYDLNGDSCYRYRHNNLYLDRYQGIPKGVFYYESPAKTADLNFITPEGIDQDSTRGAIRNRFETPYFTFDYERKEKESQVLRYKHGNGFLAFDDVLEFWINKQGKIELIKWGWLDKK
jgi:hypothetical protein